MSSYKCPECRKKDYWIEDYERKVKYWKGKYFSKIFQHPPFKTIEKIRSYLHRLETDIASTMKEIRNYPELSDTDIEITERR